MNTTGKSYAFDVTPMGAPRMVRSDKWEKRPRVLRYYAFRNLLRIQANVLRYQLTPSVDITFILPMPESWSKKKRLEMNGKPHQQVPDIDNLQKGFFDTMIGQDNFVWEVSARKYWGEKGAIIVTEK